MLSVSVSRDAQINATDISHAAIIKLNYDYHRLIPLHEIYIEKAGGTTSALDTFIRSFYFVVFILVLFMFVFFATKKTRCVSLRLYGEIKLMKLFSLSPLHSHMIFLGIAGHLRDQPSSLELQTSTDTNFLSTGSSYINERHRDLAISAVLMDEWLKEMSAISQEMSIVLLNENFKK